MKKILGRVVDALKPMLKAVAAAVASAAAVALSTGHLDWRALVSAGAGALLTWLVPNLTPTK